MSVSLFMNRLIRHRTRFYFIDEGADNNLSLTYIVNETVRDRAIKQRYLISVVLGRLCRIYTHPFKVNS